MAKIMLHPIMRNYWHIAALEFRIGRVAVARQGYIELLSFAQIAKSPD